MTEKDWSKIGQKGKDGKKLDRNPGGLVPFSTYMDKGLLKKLRVHAAEIEQPMKEIIRIALTDYFEKLDSNKKVKVSRKTGS